jgi:hypothetical protein
MLEEQDHDQADTGSVNRSRRAVRVGGRAPTSGIDTRSLTVRAGSRHSVMSKGAGAVGLVGEDTLKVAPTVTAFDPDSTWTEVQERSS